MASLFSVGYGSKNREDYILNFLQKDPSIAVILASVHFEWTMKRTILIMGNSSTPKLRKDLEEAFRSAKLKKIWLREIQTEKSLTLESVIKVVGVLEIPDVNIKPVVPSPTDSKNLDGNSPSSFKSLHAKDIRGEVIHGNGTINFKRAESAVKDFITASQNLRNFVEEESKGKKNLDIRLRVRRGLVIDH
jgi:hypothetical protein